MDAVSNYWDSLYGRYDQTNGGMQSLPFICIRHVIGTADSYRTLDGRSEQFLRELIG